MNDEITSRRRLSRSSGRWRCCQARQVHGLGGSGDRGDGVDLYCRRAEYGGLKLDQVRRLKLLEQEYGRPRLAVSDLTLEKLILKGSPTGNF